MIFCTTKSWCRYPAEGKKSKEAKLNIKAMENCVGLIKALHKLSPKLSFTRNCIHEAIIDMNKAKKFVTDEKNMESYALVLTNRVMGMCHIINTNLSRKTPPAWLDDILAACNDSASVEPPQAELATPNMSSAFEWDSNLMLAYRVCSRKKQKDYSMPINIPDDAEDHDPIPVSWMDGTVCVIDAVTVGAYKELLQTRKSASSDAALWEAEHSVTKHSIQLKQRIDKPLQNQPIATRLLVSMYEQGKQVCQVRLCKFGDVEGNGETMPPSTRQSKQRWPSCNQLRKHLPKISLRRTSCTQRGTSASRSLAPHLGLTVHQRRGLLRLWVRSHRRRSHRRHASNLPRASMASTTTAATTMLA
jgi:hypothetical protein